MPAQPASLDNPVQDYAWGSRTAIAELLGRPSPGGRPEAELWIGAHPKAPSRVVGAPGETLASLVARDPEGALGREVAARWGELPFLMKVLAAAEPLSIQCHPDRAQARAGFVRENAAGIPVGAPQRNYRDPNPKPELVVALSRFLALKGVRPVEQILAGLRSLASAALAPALARLEARADAEAVKALFAALVAHEGPARAALLDGAVTAARGRSEEAWGWVLRLRERYPSDVGVLAPLFLNLVELGPEEGLFLEAGELHAYLEGTAIELMANSDNVLRAGLTPKHVDVAELLRVARFEPRAAVVLRPAALGAGERVYRTPAAEFELGVLDVAPGAPHHALPRGAELLLGLAGDAEVAAGDRRLPLARGRSVFIPAAAAYSIQGAGRVCRARVPAL